MLAVGLNLTPPLFVPLPPAKLDGFILATLPYLPVAPRPHSQLHLSVCFILQKLDWFILGLLLVLWIVCAIAVWGVPLNDSFWTAFSAREQPLSWTLQLASSVWLHKTWAAQHGLRRRGASWAVVCPDSLASHIPMRSAAGLLASSLSPHQRICSSLKAAVLVATRSPAGLLLHLPVHHHQHLVRRGVLLTQVARLVCTCGGLCTWVASLARCACVGRR